MRVVGLNVNDSFANSGFADANQLNFSLFSDYSRSVVRLYRVRLDDFGGLPDYFVAQRAIFILDRERGSDHTGITDEPGQ
jgi:peroxiredoxin